MGVGFALSCNFFGKVANAHRLHYGIILAHGKVATRHTQLPDRHQLHSAELQVGTRYVVLDGQVIRCRHGVLEA